MSLELSLKPQGSTNWLYTWTGDFSEFIADGKDFNSYSQVYNVIGNYSGLNVLIEAADNNIPNGNWQGYRQSGGVFLSGNPIEDGLSKGNSPLIAGYTGVKFCNFDNPIFGGHSGFYQRVYGLDVGATYMLTFKVRVPNSVSSGATIVVGNISNGDSEINTGLTAGDHTFQVEINAGDTEQDVYIDFFSLEAECFVLLEAGLSEHYSDVDYTLSDFSDGSVVLDLFDDEVPLTLSVSSFTDATSNTQSYSKDFDLPSTKKNDKIFSFIYDLDSTIVDNAAAFNPYVKTIATLKEDGIEIFSGELTLNTIKVNTEGVIYSVNLQSRVSGLSEVLKNRKLVDLGFEELDHLYTKENVKDSWTGDLTLINTLSSDSHAFNGSDNTKTGVIKYPFVNYVGSIQDLTGDGDLNLTKMEDCFRPFINIKYLVDRIIDNAGFTYDGAFFDTDVFKKLFMDLNNGKPNGASIDIGGGAFEVECSNSGRFFEQDFTRFELDQNDINGNPGYSGGNILADAFWDYSTHSLKVLTDNTKFDVHTQLNVYNESTISRGGDFRTIIYRNDGSEEVIHSGGYNIGGKVFEAKEGTYSANVDEVTMFLGDELAFECGTNTSDANKIRQQNNSDWGSNNFSWVRINNLTADALSMTKMLNEARGEISQWDFIKSLMNMFNLIIAPSEDRSNHLIISPYDSVFGLEGYNQLAYDPYFNEGGTGYFTSANTSVGSTNFAGNLKISTTGNLNSGSDGVYGEEIALIDGESYTVEVDVDSISNTSNGEAIKVIMYGGSSYVESSGEINTTGIHRFNFIYDDSLNGWPTSELRGKIQMKEGDTYAFDVVIKSFKVLGKSTISKNYKDWTTKIDKDKSTIKLMELDKNIDFTLKDDKDDFAANVYSDAVGTSGGGAYSFGDLKFQATYYSALFSTAKVNTNPFAATLIKPLNDYSPLNEIICPAIYKKKGAEEFEVYKNVPRILYDNGVKSFGGTYTSPTQNASPGFINEDEYLQFSPYSDIENDTNGYSVPSTAFDLNWDTCQAFIINNSLNSLFNEYWSAYYDELYHPDTRTFSVTAYLTSTDISNFSFTDIIRIENKEFRVDSIDYRAKKMSKIKLIKLP